jgi:hypothetical protein
VYKDDTIRSSGECHYRICKMVNSGLVVFTGNSTPTP